MARLDANSCPQGLQEEKSLLWWRQTFFKCAELFCTLTPFILFFYSWSLNFVLPLFLSLKTISLIFYPIHPFSISICFLLLQFMNYSVWWSEDRHGVDRNSASEENRDLEQGDVRGSVFTWYRCVTRVVRLDVCMSITMVYAV